MTVTTEFEPTEWLILKLDRGLVDIYPTKASPGYDVDRALLPAPDGFTAALHACSRANTWLENLIST